MAAIPQPRRRASAEAEQIARGVVASIPPRSAPAEYTRFFVDNAISRYETQGLDATLAYYNREESVDGQWYVFIIDQNDEVIGHYDPDRRGLDVKGWVGTDINGYNFGPEMLAATEAGRWVPYVYVNPAAGTLGDEGAFELKNAWVIRHDGLLFASGWHINTEEFVPQLMSESAEHFRSGGPATWSSTTTPEASLWASYRPWRTTTAPTPSTGTSSGSSQPPTARSSTSIPGSSNSNRGLLGPAVHNATPDGAWITAEDNPAEAAGPQHNAHLGHRRKRHPHRRRPIPEASCHAARESPGRVQGSLRPSPPRPDAVSRTHPHAPRVRRTPSATGRSAPAHRYSRTRRCIRSPRTLAEVRVRQVLLLPRSRLGL